MGYHEPGVGVYCSCQSIIQNSESAGDVGDIVEGGGANVFDQAEVGCAIGRLVSSS